MKKKLVKSKKKKGFSLKDKIIASASIFAIIVSWTTIAAQAAITWNPSRDMGPLIGNSYNLENLNMGRSYIGNERCGDGIINSTEECDGANFGGQTCKTKGFDGGNLTCSTYCLIDVSGCIRNARCGNGIKDVNEECDGVDFGGQTCKTKGYDGGDLICSVNCYINASKCINNTPCTDTDGGGDLFIKGTIKGPDWLGNPYREYDDECLEGSENPRIILEYFCDDGIIQVIYTDCPGECVDGACVK